MQSLILNLAPTGIVPTKRMNRYVPLTVAEIVEDARHCIASGVSMLHLHVRDELGQPTYHKEVYARVIDAIRQFSPEVIICVSLSGRKFHTFKQRADPLFLSGDLKPDMASLTLASMNVGRTASMNSPEMIRRLAERMAEVDIKPELEVFDSGMINYARYLAERGQIQPPFFFNLMLGNVASGQAKPLQIGAILADFPPDSFWIGGGVGADQLAMNTMGMLYGNGVRVGLEDYLWLDQERRQPASNLQLVQRVRALADVLGKKFATPLEVRKALGLKMYV